MFTEAEIDEIVQRRLAEQNEAFKEQAVKHLDDAITCLFKTDIDAMQFRLIRERIYQITFEIKGE